MSGQNQSTNRSMATRPALVRPPAAMQMTMTPKEIVGILRRHVLLIILLTVLGTVIGVGSWFLLRQYYPRYTSVGAIEVLEPKGDPTKFRDFRTTQDIIDQLRNSRVSRIKSLGMLQELLRRDKIRQTKWFKQFTTATETDLSKAVKNLKKNLKANAPRDMNLVRVSMTCGNKKESALIVNEMLELFLMQQKAGATSDISDQLRMRQSQQNKLRKELDVANSELRTIREGTQFSNLGETSFRDYLTESLADQQTSLNTLENSRVRLESLVEILQRRAEGEYDEVMREQMEQDPVARRMRDSIAALEPALAQLLTRFGENHRQVKEIRDALKQRKQDLARRQVEIADILRKASYRNANDQLIAFTAELEAQTKQVMSLKAEYRDMNSIRAGYLEAMARRDEKQTLLEEMNTHIEKLRTLLDDPQTSQVKIGWSAQEPLEMSSPMLVLYLPGGFILGLFTAIALAFAIELLNDLVRSPSDVMKHLRAPLLGMICHSDEDSDVKGTDLAQVVRQAPYSITSECYRQFRTNLKLSGGEETRKVLLITSGAGGDGKTSVAVNLASTLVAENKKVLLIDANFRRPMTATLFPRSYAEDETGENAQNALSNYLLGQCGIDEGIIRPSGVEGFDIIDSGPLPSSPAELLASTAMHDLLEKKRTDYDYIIIDGPPLLVSDAKTLAALADGTILVFNAESTHRGAAQRALRELREINANLVGTVLLGVKAMKGGYFQEAFRSYQEYQRADIAQPAM